MFLAKKIIIFLTPPNILRTRHVYPQLPNRQAVAELTGRRRHGPYGATASSPSWRSAHAPSPYSRSPATDRMIRCPTATADSSLSSEHTLLSRVSSPPWAPPPPSRLLRFSLCADWPAVWKDPWCRLKGGGLIVETEKFTLKMQPVSNLRSLRRFVRNIQRCSDILEIPNNVTESELDYPNLDQK